MIHYTEVKSPFFDNNKVFCNEIETFAKNNNAQLNGFCNAFGYEINLDFSLDNLIFHLTFIKKQSTQNGIIIPINAIDFFRIHFTAKTFDKLEFSYGKSKLKRWFMLPSVKKLVPNNYYLFTNTSQENTLKLISIITHNNQNDLIHLKSGRLTVKKHTNTTNPISLIDEMAQFATKLKSNF